MFFKNFISLQPYSHKFGKKNQTILYFSAIDNTLEYQKPPEEHKIPPITNEYQKFVFHSQVFDLRSLAIVSMSLGTLGNTSSRLKYRTLKMPPGDVFL